ncbi:MAG: TonB family protein [Burkholderiales bacterium]
MNPDTRSAAPAHRHNVTAMRFAIAFATSMVLHASVVIAAAVEPAKPAAAPAKPVVGSADPVYYKRSQLEARPYIVTKVDPAFPIGGPPTGGKARIRLFINERGFVDRVTVVESAASAKFGEAAADAFRKAQFEPGKLKGVAVKSQVLIEVDFPSLLPPGVK